MLLRSSIQGEIYIFTVWPQMRPILYYNISITFSQNIHKLTHANGHFSGGESWPEIGGRLYRFRCAQQWHRLDLSAQHVLLHNLVSQDPIKSAHKGRKMRKSEATKSFRTS
jgi:hypothetical protein